ncbi:hypothetical protein BJY52DRAFT_100524 [Lactarius psammicola]|nr:hypothetical protein BJY52DRAFT_100524 [Lactarius psammicola]
MLPLHLQATAACLTDSHVVSAAPSPNIVDSPPSFRALASFPGGIVCLSRGTEAVNNYKAQVITTPEKFRSNLRPFKSERERNTRPSPTGIIDNLYGWVAVPPPPHGHHRRTTTRAYLSTHARRPIEEDDLAGTDVDQSTCAHSLRDAETGAGHLVGDEEQAESLCLFPGRDDLGVQYQRVALECGIHLPEVRRKHVHFRGHTLTSSRAWLEDPKAMPHKPRLRNQPPIRK